MLAQGGAVIAQHMARLQGWYTHTGVLLKAAHDTALVHLLFRAASVVLSGA